MRVKAEKAPEIKSASADYFKLQGRIETLETDARALRS